MFPLDSSLDRRPNTTVWIDGHPHTEPYVTVSVKRRAQTLLGSATVFVVRWSSMLNRWYRTLLKSTTVSIIAHAYLISSSVL